MPFPRVLIGQKRSNVKFENFRDICFLVVYNPNKVAGVLSVTAKGGGGGGGVIVMFHST